MTTLCFQYMKVNRYIRLRHDIPVATLAPMTEEAPVELSNRGALGTVRNATLFLDLLGEEAPLRRLCDRAPSPAPHAAIGAR